MRLLLSAVIVVRYVIGKLYLDEKGSPYAIAQINRKICRHFVIGNPLKWRNIELNTTIKVDDPAWKDLVLWSNETSKDVPLLDAVNRNRTLPRALTAEELENETLKQFQKLKVNSYTWAMMGKAR